MPALNSIKKEILECVGRKFNNLLVIDLFKDNKKGKMFRCKCDCGEIIETYYYKVISGHTKSCGCNQGKRLKHGMTRNATPTDIYNVWRNMKYRCYNPKAKYWHVYGGRGISVCERWLNSFESFWEDMKSGYKKGLTLDRINVNGNYEPTNCRWADIMQQHRNKRTNVNITYNGRTMIIKDWAKEVGIKESTLGHRINTWKWPIEKALLTPPLHEPRNTKKQTTKL